MHRQLSLGHSDYQKADSVSRVAVRRNFEQNIGVIVGRHSLGGVATGYGLGWSGDRTPAGTRFSAPIQIVPGALPASCTMGAGCFPGVRRPGLSVGYPPQSIVEVKELLLLLTFLACSRVNFTVHSKHRFSLYPGTVFQFVCLFLYILLIMSVLSRSFQTLSNFTFNDKYRCFKLRLYTIR